MKKNRKNSKIKLQQACDNAIKRCLLYSKIQEQVKKIPETKLNFNNSKYGVGQKYYFPYSFSSAKTIVEFGAYSKNILSLLKDHFFEDQLNLYSSSEIFEEANPWFPLNIAQKTSLEISDFTKSKLNQKQYLATLEISNWTYVELVTSATFFYLNTIHTNYLAKNKINGEKKNFYELQVASSQIALLLLSPILSGSIFEIIENTNSFTNYFSDWLYGFTSFLNYKASIEDERIDSSKKFTELINTFFSGDFSGIRCYLYAFKSIIPNSIIEVCSAYCINARSVVLVYYILKQYQTILDEILTSEEK